MAQKRALVVDDSRSARVALQRLLEQHDIKVEFAESGEDAIEFLRHQLVDVIFMDHSMPGMDGFEAVSVIKADPRTAVIPVMMYTAKEGEVYVGQARALGAVGVLPKQVQPGVLYEMLLKLGLVQERRAGTRRRAADSGRATPLEEVDRALERQALGMSIQALITRTLQDQHLELRTDLLASNRDFARRVAEEIHAKQKAEAALESPPGEGKRGFGAGAVVALLVLALLPLVVMFRFHSEVVQQRDAALVENVRLRDLAADQATALDASWPDAFGGSPAEGPEHFLRYAALLEALQWAVNQGNHYAYGELPFGDGRLERLRELVARLAAVGFTGRVRLDAHLGEFCLEDDGEGGYRPARPDTLITDCALIGQPTGPSAAPGERQSVAFANFLATSPLLQATGIEVEVHAHGPRDSVRRYPFPLNMQTAGEWNRVAELNNRVEFQLIPAE